MSYKDKKLSICIVSREYPPETLWGGIGTFTYHLAHGLNNIGHTVDVIAFTFGDEVCHNDGGINVHRIKSPRILRSKKSLWDYLHLALTPFAFFYSYKVGRKIEELDKVRKYDVIDFPEHIGEGFFHIYKNRHPSLVRLYTPLSLIGRMVMNKSTNSIDYYLFGLMERISIKKSTIINSPSKALAEFVKREFKIKRSIELIYNPIDTDVFSPKPNVNIKKDDQVTVLFLGRVSDRKGAHILALAIPRVLEVINEIKFIIVGNDDIGVDGYASMKDYMSSIFEKHDISNRIEFRSPVKYSELPDIYALSDISVVPSLYDNSPYACVEAMSCGLPVIGTDAGGIPEYIENHNSGMIIPSNNVDALSHAIIELAEDKNKREKYGKSARERVLNNFKREVVANEISQLYLNAIDEHQYTCF